MVQIVIGIVLTLIGLIMQESANLTAEYSYMRHPEYILIGGMMVFAGALFIIVGIKKYYLSEIIELLKKK